MLNLRSIPRRTARVAADNSPLILTAMGVAGTVTTAFFTGRATWKAKDVLDEYQYHIDEGRRANLLDDLSLKEKVGLTWKFYVPAAAAGTMTVTCIIVANRVGTRRAAALAAAYVTSQEVWQEYENKVKENIGEKKNQEIRDELAAERANRDSRASTSSPIILASANSQLCHEAFTGRFFESDMQTIRKAQNDINQQILHSDYATLTNFYNNIDSPDLPPTTSSDDFGWNTDKLMEVEFASILIEDGPYKGQTALSFDFAVIPIREPWRFC